MREVFSISLDRKIKRQLDKLAKEKGSNRSVIVKEALKKYLFVEEMRKTRRQLRPFAEKKGIMSEQDVFDIIS